MSEVEWGRLCGAALAELRGIERASPQGQNDDLVRLLRETELGLHAARPPPRPAPPRPAPRSAAQAQARLTARGGAQVDGRQRPRARRDAAVGKKKVPLWKKKGPLTEVPTRPSARARGARAARDGRRGAQAEREYVDQLGKKAMPRGRKPR
jgi:hypothetical protein